MHAGDADEKLPDAETNTSFDKWNASDMKTQFEILSPGQHDAFAAAGDDRPTPEKIDRRWIDPRNPDAPLDDQLILLSGGGYAKLVEEFEVDAERRAAKARRTGDSTSKSKAVFMQEVINEVAVYQNLDENAWIDPIGVKLKPPGHQLALRGSVQYGGPGLDTSKHGMLRFELFYFGMADVANPDSTAEDVELLTFDLATNDSRGVWNNGVWTCTFEQAFDFACIREKPGVKEYQRRMALDVLSSFTHDNHDRGRDIVLRVYALEDETDGFPAVDALGHPSAATTDYRRQLYMQRYKVEYRWRDADLEWARFYHQGGTVIAEDLKGKFHEQKYEKDEDGDDDYLKPIPFTTKQFKENQETQVAREQAVKQTFARLMKEKGFAIVGAVTRQGYAQEVNATPGLLPMLAGVDVGGKKIYRGSIYVTLSSSFRQKERLYTRRGYDTPEGLQIMLKRDVRFAQDFETVVAELVLNHDVFVREKPVRLLDAKYMALVKRAAEAVRLLFDDQLLKTPVWITHELWVRTYNSAMEILGRPERLVQRPEAEFSAEELQKTRDKEYEGEDEDDESDNDSDGDGADAERVEGTVGGVGAEDVD